MTKELSKQLCVLCGMEPKYYFYDLRYKEFIEINHKTYLKLKNEYQTKEAYPDFGNPKNFIRLFNLKWYLPDDEYGTQEAGLAFYVLFNYGNSSQDWNTEGFIRILIEILQNTRSELYIKYIKQSIREAEWVYD